MAENSTAARKSLSQTSNLDRRVYALLEDTEGRVQIEAHAFLAGHFRFNWNNALELMMVLKGHMRLCTEDGVFELRETDFALININKGHAGLQEELLACFQQRNNAKDLMLIMGFTTISPTIIR